MSIDENISNYQRIVQRMITEELQLDLNTPSFVIWKHLQSKLSDSRQNIQDFNYSLESHNQAYCVLYLIYQLVGEIIQDAEANGQSIFEDDSQVQFMEIDSNYTYNDECAIFSRFRLVFKSNTDQIIDSGWSMEDYDTEICIKIVSMYIGELLWNVFGEDSLYEDNFALLQQIYPQRNIDNIDFPTGIGFSMEHLFPRTRDTYDEWFANRYATSPQEKSALLELFEEKVEYKNWVNTYIPQFPQLIDVLYPIDATGKRNLNSDLYSLNIPSQGKDNMAIYIVQNDPSEEQSYNQNWKFSLLTIQKLSEEIQSAVLDRLPNIHLNNHPNARNVLHWLRDKEGIIHDVPRLKNALIAGNAIARGESSESSEVILSEDISDLTEVLSRLPNVEFLDVLGNCTSVGVGSHNTITSIYISRNYNFCENTSIEEIVSFWKNCPSLEIIHGQWLYDHSLTSRAEIDDFCSTMLNFQAWLSTSNAMKIRTLLRSNDVESGIQGIELWRSIREKADLELKTYFECVFNKIIKDSINWEARNQFYQESEDNPFYNQKSTSCNYGYGSEGPEILDVSNNKILEKIELYAQAKMKRIILSGSTNIKKITIDGVNFLEEIEGLEECSQLEHLHIEDSTGTMEHQNEKWGYFMDSGQFKLTNFNWKKFSKQLEALKNLKTLIIRSAETKIYNSKLPDSIEKIRVQDGIQFDVIFPQSLQNIFLYPDAQKHVEDILSLPNIEDCSFSIPSLDLPDINSTVKKLTCNPKTLANISAYKQLEELHIQVKEEIKPEIIEIKSLPLQKLGILVSDNRFSSKLSVAGHFNVYWKKDLSSFWNSLDNS